MDVVELELRNRHFGLKRMAFIEKETKADTKVP
jgi:hypothetical protein